MATWLDEVLDTTGLRPAVVTWAAILSVMAGGVTLVASAIVVLALLGSWGAVNWGVILAWAVAVTQVVAAVLLITGGERLAVGAQRTRLVAGAALHLLVCAVYLLLALTVVARTEPPAVVYFAVISSIFAAMSASSLFLALRRTTAEYVTLFGHTARPRPI